MPLFLRILLCRNWTLIGGVLVPWCVCVWQHAHCSVSSVNDAERWMSKRRSWRWLGQAGTRRLKRATKAQTFFGHILHGSGATVASSRIFSKSSKQLSSTTLPSVRKHDRRRASDCSTNCVQVHPLRQWVGEIQPYSAENAATEILHGQKNSKLKNCDVRTRHEGISRGTEWSGTTARHHDQRRKF